MDMRKSKRRKVFLKLLLLQLLFPILIFTQQANIRFKHLSSNDGLSQSSVNCILQDSKGFMWFGTQDGLNRFDGHEFKVYRHNPDENDTIFGYYIWAICEDQEGRLWLGTDGGGLILFEPKIEKFTRFLHDSKNPNSLSHNAITSIVIDEFDTLWIGTREGGLNSLNTKNESLKDLSFKIFKHDSEHIHSISDNTVNCIFLDNHKNLWIGTDKRGLCYKKPGSDQFNRIKIEDGLFEFEDMKVTSIFEDHSGKFWIGTNMGLIIYDQIKNSFDLYDLKTKQENGLKHTISAIAEDKSNILWIGTKESGLYILDSERRTEEKFFHNPNISYSLSKNQIMCIYQSASGIMWIGTRTGGLNIFAPQTARFSYYHHIAGKEVEGLNNNDIRAIYQDKEDIIWIGTRGGGLTRFDRSKGKAEHYKLKNNIVRCIIEDNEGNLWIGTEGGGISRFNKKEKFEYFSVQNWRLSNNEVWTMYQDKEGEIWVGTSGGLSKFNHKESKFSIVVEKTGNKKGLNDNIVKTIFEDSKRRLWIGTRGGGLNLYDRQQKEFRYFKHNPRDDASISHNFILSIYEDQTGTIWVGTFGGGLNKLIDIEKGIFISYQDIKQESKYNGKSNSIRGSKRKIKKQGPPNNLIYGILSDRERNLWISTNKGISKFNPVSEVFTDYDTGDGLQGDEFNVGAYFKNPITGEMFFGGLNGLNAFDPARLKKSQHTPLPLLITNCLLNNKPVELKWQNEDSPFKKVIHETQSFILSHKFNVLTFEFAALDYNNPGKLCYRYRLEGWNTEDGWIETDSKNRRATYTNLPPGEYKFRVQVKDSNGKWRLKNASIKLKQLPPWWRTWWAYSLYVLSGAVLLFLFWYINFQKKIVVYERQVNERLKQVDKQKDEFLSNTSHELFSPLTGIIGLAESLLNGAKGPVNQSIAYYLSIIIASTKRLTYLVNDILDFSQIRESSLKLHIKPVDIHILADVVLVLSKHLIINKKLELVNDIPEDIPVVKGDENRLQQIIHNLVNNAIKFTEQGTIRISAEVKEKMVIVHVSDTGVGIPRKNITRIFKPFEQCEDQKSKQYGGAGLGLAITKELVKLHSGEIWLDSTVNHGSTFSFSLPVSDEPERQKIDFLLPESSTPLPLGDTYGEILAWMKFNDEMDTPEAGDYHILVVDDNIINRKIIRDFLSTGKYFISEASSGIDALKMIDEGLSFDLVLLDLMMPQMSGFEVCKKMRELYSPHELPIIFLTAKNQPDALQAAFNVGANDFLTKPVNNQELTTRINTHLQLLNNIREIKKIQGQLSHSEKMASLGTLIAGVAHEINNPACYAYTSSYNLKRDIDRFKIFLIELAGDDVEKEILDVLDEKFLTLFNHIEAIKDGTARISAIVKNLKTFSRTNEGEFNRIDVNEGLRATLNLIKPQYKKDVEFVYEIEKGLEIDGNLGQLNQVFMNIIRNACDSIIEKRDNIGDDSKGKLVIRTRIEKEYAVIDFIDSGTGMSEQTRKKMFDPFFTMKAEGKGLGLGLSLSFNIIEEHGGKIEVESKLGEGTTIQLQLPTNRSTNKH